MNKISGNQETHSSLQQSHLKMLETLQRETFDYFLKNINPENGLIADKSAPDSPSSIAVVGIGLSCYIVGVEQGYLSREEAIKRTLSVLKFFYNGEQGSGTDTMGYKGFFYHFLSMQTGSRVFECELSTIDTSIFIAGALVAAQYFTGEGKEETEIRRLANDLYRQVDWQWALNGGTTVSHGWRPETGFLRYRWDTGYSEAIILYVLALGSPGFPINPTGYKEWTSTFKWKKIYETEYIYAGPLFIHQMSHLWLDFLGIHDDLNKKTGIDYFENTSRATYIHQQYAIKNPLGFKHYNENNWGFTACDGPGPGKFKIDGVQRKFYDYKARGVPFGPDDGTISPWAVVASLPFAPEIVLKTMCHAIQRLEDHGIKKTGFDASFNPIYPASVQNPNGWVSPWKFGLNEGPIILMIENFQSQLIWNLIRKSPHIIHGLRLAGFEGGWLDQVT
jgi:hypothetical protein